MKPNEPIFCMPSGRGTTDTDQYLKAWRKLAAPICEITGAKAVAYDPGIEFMLPDKSRFDCPLILAKAIYKQVRGLDFFEE